MSEESAIESKVVRASDISDDYNALTEFIKLVQKVEEKSDPIKITKKALKKIKKVLEKIDLNHNNKADIDELKEWLKSKIDKILQSELKKGRDWSAWGESLLWLIVIMSKIFTVLWSAWGIITQISLGNLLLRFFLTFIDLTLWAQIKSKHWKIERDYKEETTVQKEALNQASISDAVTKAKLEAANLKIKSQALQIAHLKGENILIPSPFEIQNADPESESILNGDQILRQRVANDLPR